MDKVYVLVAGYEYGIETIHAICKTKELAEKRKDEYLKDRALYHPLDFYLEIIEIEVLSE